MKLVKVRMSYRFLDMLPLLLALFLSTPATAAVPAMRNTTTITSPPFIYNIGHTEPTHKCTKVGFFKSDKRPTWPECYRAIRTLPHGHESGTFHNGGSNDGYRLPVTERFGRCRAQVEIEEHGQVVGSWVMVTAALDQLSILCRKSTSQGERTSGWMLVRPDNMIKVSLLGPDDPIFGTEGAGGVLLSNGTELE